MPAATLTPFQIKPRPRFLPQVQKAAPVPAARGYYNASAIGGINSDWALIGLSEDADLYRNWRNLLMRSRDLAKEDVFFQKYREELQANVIGSSGPTMRLNIRSEVTGQHDLIKAQAVEGAFTAWANSKKCSANGRHTLQEMRLLRIWLAARDGECFIRIIRDRRLNRFGIALQLIQTEWCPHELNEKLSNGNEIRMGIEYDAEFGRPVRYYFAKERPDFRTQYNLYSGMISREACIAVDAEDVIHYARFTDADQTRPAPWTTPVIILARHIGKYQEATVISARVEACKVGILKSTIVAEGGNFGAPPDPTKIQNFEVTPGSVTGLPYGVDFQSWDPKHANGNFEQFRNGVLRSFCAGLPGANYNIIANDLKGVNYSSGRLGMLDERELWKMLQAFDITNAETPIFEAWLYTQVVTGDTLPNSVLQAGFDALNQPLFNGRRWAWVDPLKEAEANRLEIANHLKSPRRVLEEQGIDFEEEMSQIRDDFAFMRSMGLTPPQPDGKPVVIEDEEETPQTPKNDAETE